jgi:hypothetical protein
MQNRRAVRNPSVDHGGTSNTNMLHPLRIERVKEMPLYFYQQNNCYIRPRTPSSTADCFEDVSHDGVPKFLADVSDGYLVALWTSAAGLGETNYLIWRTLLWVWGRSSVHDVLEIFTKFAHQFSPSLLYFPTTSQDGPCQAASTPAISICSFTVQTHNVRSKEPLVCRTTLSPCSANACAWNVNLCDPGGGPVVGVLHGAAPDSRD